MRVGLQEPNNGQMVTRQSVQGAQTSNSRGWTEVFGNSKVSMSGGLSISKQSRQDKLPVAHKELKGKGDRAKLRHDTGEELAAVLSNIWVSPWRLLALWSCPPAGQDCPLGVVLCFCGSPLVNLLPI